MAYWYGAPAACLVPTDSLQLGDPISEQAHAYSSPDATPATRVTTRWDLGPDSVGSTVIQNPSSDLERHTAGTSELTVAVDPRNQGVLLRRKLDARFANQRAEVFVAKLGASGLPGPFEHAGTWYLAGGATVLFSDPPDELGAAEINVENPDRRWREDELLLPPTITHGRNALRLRMVFAPLHLPLTPDMPVGEEAWSEVRYDVFSYLSSD